MTHLRTVGPLVGAMALLLSAGCRPSLDVTNPNAPDVARALASAEDVKNLAISSVNSWYLGSTYIEPYLMFSVTSDVGGANFGNFGMRFNNLEPRVPYGNNSAGGDRGVAASPWDNSYSALGAANDALRAFANGVVLTAGAAETAKYKQLAMFVQAAELTNLALIFDKSFIVDEATTEPALSPYKDVSAAAMAKWAAVIAATAGGTNAYDPTVLPMTVGPLTSTRLNRISSTMAALTLAYTPRNAAEAGTVDWAKVATYAANGIGTGNAGAPFNMEVVGDNNNWYSYINYYGNEASWVRIDLRLINRMDPNTPAKFAGVVPPRGSSPDARFTSDYDYKGNVIGDPARGVYMQTPYFHKRYITHSRTSPTAGATAVPYLLAAESDLVRAEALIRTTSGADLATAASLINITRVGRGTLTPATAADGAATLLGYINYERDVELPNTSGFTLMQRRHVDGLQAGTVHHLPIPAKELETLGLPIYTFGGPGLEQSVGSLDGGLMASFSPFNGLQSTIEAPNGKVLGLHFPTRPSRPSLNARQ